MFGISEIQLKGQHTVDVFTRSRNVKCTNICIKGHIRK